MVKLSEFVHCRLKDSPFQKRFNENTSYFLVSSQILFCGIALLGNCVSVHSTSLKIFLAIFGGTLFLSGVERVIDVLSCVNLISYPFAKKLQSFMDNTLDLFHIPSVFVKCWMFGSTIGLFFKTTTLSVFSLTLLLLWLSISLIFDVDAYFPDIFTFSCIWTDFLEDLVLCLNVFMAVWFLGFWKMPIV
ncbi:hypothetical protein [Candidatus Similichlamydia epinepheli]|uniref:hypothetical protein n=1 Tax=Candidatus Similichlamydia epinepheli TaxID=1903953 RepID=UPI000D387E2D|nr:hypothetical protein [Candidatus Similichlamydia epinepheli]